MAENQDPISYKDFSKRIKEKYPEYKDVDDLVLSQKMVEKYPDYKGTVIFDEVKKKEPTISSAIQLPLPNQKVSSVNQIGNALSGGVIQDFDETKVPKKENDYFKQVAVGIKPSAQGNVVERIYENPMGVEVLQVEPKKREVAPKQPVQKSETKDKPLKGVKPIAPTNSELNEQGWLLNMVSALDKGVYKTLGTTAQGAGTLLQGVTSKITGGTGEGFVSDALIKFGDSYNKMIDELTPQDESFKGSLSDQVGNALGYVAGLILTGGGSSAARTAGMSVAGRNAATVASQVPKTLPMAVKEAISSVVAPTGIVGGLGMGQAEFDRAKEAGATDEQAFEAFYKNAAMGSILEQIPVMHFLKRFNNATAGGVINYIKTKGVAGITGGVEEMTTEMLQQLYANKTAKDIYNTNQDLFEGVVGNGTIGFSVGFLLNAMGANAKILRKQGKVNEAKLVENQVKELQEKAKGVAPTNNAITTKIAVNGNEEGLQRTQAELDNDLQKGLISEEEYQEKAAIAQRAAEFNAKIPDYVQGINRAESIELINEREALQQELIQKEEQKKGIDVAYHKSIDESNKEVQKRIDEINNQLGELAKPEKNVEEALVEDWSKDVESIEKNLKDKIVISPDGRSNNLWGIEELVPYEEKQEIMRLFIDGDYSKSVPISRIIAEAYNKAKSDNSNPKLVKAVEDLLGTPKNKVAEEEIQQPIEDAVEINVLSMLKESKILSKTEKAILYRQYKNGVMNENDISKYTNVEINDLKNDNITKWAKVILDKTKAKKIDAEDIDFEEILNEPIQQIPDENIQPPIEEQGEVVEAVRVEQEPEAKPQKVFAEKDLDRAKAKKVHQRVREMEAPSDAAQIALRYIADGGKVSEAAINEVAGTVKRARLNTGAKELKSNEAKSRDYYQKDGETLDELAHRLWENSSQEVSEIDIKDALMSVIGDYNTRLEAGTAYLEQYNAEYIQEKYYERLAEEREEEWKKEQDELERQLRTDVDEQIEGEASEEHINNLIKQYESEFKAENQQPKPASKADANKEIGGRASGKEDGNEKGKVGEQPIGEAKPKQEDVEKELIIKKAKENDSLYKAPNGKKSNLSNDLWVLVRTKKFKEKFGDWEAEESNVLKDENGEPMKVYHGTAYDPTKGMFTEFDRSKNKFGYTFFSSNRDAAIEWSKDRMTYTKTEPYIVEAFISLDNPAIKDYKGGFISDEDISLFQKSKEKSYIIKNVIDTAEGREIVNDVYAVDNENVFSINLSNLSGEVKENLKEGQKIAEENKGSELSWVKESKKIGGVDALFIKSNDEMGVAGGSMGSVSKKYVLGKRNFYNYDGYEIQEIVPRKDLNQDQSVKYFVKSKVDPNELYEFKNDVDWGKVKQQEKVLKEKMLSDINNADLSKLDKIISNKDKENIDKIIKSKVAKGKSESISFLETIRDFYKEKIPYPYSIEVLAKIVIEKGGNVESLNNIKDIIYETKNKEESEIILNKKQVKKEQPKTLLEEEYEEVTKKKGEKAQQKAKEKLIEDNFKGIVAQLMTANKIKRRGDCD